MPSFLLAERRHLLRKRLEQEFSAFALGAGNLIMLALFWPGWLAVGGVSIVTWLFYGALEDRH
jgi:hypothetical protein